MTGNMPQPISKTQDNVALCVIIFNMARLSTCTSISIVSHSTIRNMVRLDRQQGTTLVAATLASLAYNRC